MFILPPGVRNIVWKRVWFLNLRDRVASRLKLRPRAVWRGTAFDGTQVVLGIPGEKVMKLTQRNSNWSDMYTVKHLDRFMCMLLVESDRVYLRLLGVHSCSWCAPYRDQWFKNFEL